MIFVVPNLIGFFGGKQVQAMAFFPFIFIRNKELVYNKRLILHEKIHWCQQLELALVLFYPLYLMFYLYFRLKKYNHREAYFKIPFEKEAYKHDGDSQYLLKRRPYQWFYELYK